MAIDVSTLSIVKYPEAILRKKSAPLAKVTDEVRAVARRMIELMVEAEGIGLAAPQVGVAWRMFVAHVPPEEGRSVEPTPAPGSKPGLPPTALIPPTANREPQVYINPVLSKPEGAPEAYNEGCLSLPEIRGDVLRPPIISITALDLNGEKFTQRGAGLLARCWQHECDHLDGVLIIDRMSQLSRLKNKSALRDLEREAGKR